MLIQNYGLHWKREEVNWGPKGFGNKGWLIGRLAKRARAPNVNFRDQAGIYILQDGFRPIYIGQSGRSEQRLFHRLRGHTRNHLAERWDRFSWFGIYPVEGDNLDTAFEVGHIQTNIDIILDHLEGALIAVTEPPLNRQTGRFGGAQQYKQIDLRMLTAPEVDDQDEEED